MLIDSYFFLIIFYLVYTYQYQMNYLFIFSKLKEGKYSSEKFYI